MTRISQILKDIIWFPVILSVLSIYFVGYEEFYVVLLVMLLFFVIKNKLQIPIPRIPGFGFLCFYALTVLLQGFFLYQYPFRDILRDIFYITTPIVCMMLGYTYCTLNHKKKDICDTVLVFALVTSIGNILTALLTSGFSFEGLRISLSNGIAVISYAFIISFVNIIEPKNNFSKRTNAFISLIFLGNILLCMSRAPIIAAGGALLVSLFYMLFIQMQYSSRVFWKTIFISIAVLIILVFLGIHYLPGNAVNEFINKMVGSLNEVSPDVNFSTTSSIVESWRGYEIANAKKMFYEGNLFQQLFGFGAGKQIDVPALATLYSDNRYGATSPSLHNGYYTILIKGGIVGIGCYLLFFLAIIYNSIKKMKHTYISNVLIYMCVYMLIATYVIRGLMGQGTDFWWTFFVGYIFAKQYIESVE